MASTLRQGRRERKLPVQQLAILGKPYRPIRPEGMASYTLFSQPSAVSPSL